MPLLRCSSCRAQLELARPVLVERCSICGGVLLPASPVPQVLDDEPTRPRPSARVARVAQDVPGQPRR